LLTRDPRGVELTEAGEAFLQHARLTLEMADRAVESARLAPRGHLGNLKLGTLAGETPALVTDLLRAFDQRHPEVKLEVNPGYTHHHVDELMRHALDVAIVLAPFERPESMRYEGLGKIELLAAVPGGHRLASMAAIPVAELMTETYLGWPRSVNPPLIDYVNERLFGGREHPRIVELPDVTEHARLLLVAEGEGVTVSISTQLAEVAIPRVAFRHLVEAPTIAFGMAWLEANASPWVTAFATLAREMAQP
jgi:DNA-binding transcriptional LysR family regulator